MVHLFSETRSAASAAQQGQPRVPHHFSRQAMTNANRAPIGNTSMTDSPQVIDP
jgi:hypothetical protein